MHPSHEDRLSPLIPDPPLTAEIQKALDMVMQLIEAQGAVITLDYELAPSVYSKARVSDVSSVNLWLGANTMVEYPLEEARVLLETNLSHCKANIATAHADIALIQVSGREGGGGQAVAGAWGGELQGPWADCCMGHLLESFTARCRDKRSFRLAWRDGLHEARI